MPSTGNQERGLAHTQNSSFLLVHPLYDPSWTPLERVSEPVETLFWPWKSQTYHLAPFIHCLRLGTMITLT